MITKLYDNIKKYIKENLWFIIALLIILFLFNFELPYTIEVPGGFIGLSNRIKIDNSYESKGEFGLAYVSMLKGNIPMILLSKIIPNWDLVNKDDLKYDNESIKEANLRNKLYLNEAISSATYVAYKSSNNYIEIKDKKIYVSYNDNENSELKTGDNIIKIDNIDINDVSDVKNYLETLDENTYVKVTIIRDDKELVVDCKIKDYNGSKKLGVAIINNYELDANPHVEFSTKDNESGPSGGLMMAISIYDKLVSEDLTKGDKIIGTGTIDIDGNVGEIGGIKYKLIGAVNNNVKLFLCPKENYEEAINIVKDNNYDIIVKDVSTFEEAINYLKER